MARIAHVRRAARAGRFILVVLALCSVFLLGFVANAHAVTFDPTKIVSDDTFRDYASMNQADIQAFLQSSPVLASCTATDYATGKKTLASQIIYNAAQKFRINPKILLTLLQKEQSLLTRSKGSLITKRHATLDWALGMGCPDVDLSKPATYKGCIKSGCHTKAPGDNRYPEYRGFGKQIWAASWSLDAYGEKGKTRPSWHHTAKPYAESGWTVGNKLTLDIPVKVAVSKMYPGGYKWSTQSFAINNLTTYKLYTYNPSVGAMSPYGDLSAQARKPWMSGNANFWLIYRQYFGDTFADLRMRAIFRLRNKSNGNYLYTKSQAERYKLVNSGAWRYEKVAFSSDTSATANNQPVVRFYSRKTKQYLFTASGKTTRWLRSASQKATWRFEGAAFMSSSSAVSSTPVYQFTNKKSGMYFLTASPGEKSSMLSAANRKKWAFKGVAFYMAHL